MYKIEYNKKFTHGKMRNKEKSKIYKILYNQDDYEGRSLIFIILSLFSGFYIGKVLIIDIFKDTFTDFFKVGELNLYLSILVFIITGCIYVYCFYKLLKSFLKIETSKKTCGFLGVNKPYTECFLDLSNEEYIRIFNENVGNRIFYSDIKKIYKIKWTIFIKYGKKGILSIPVGKDNVQGFLELLNNNKNNIEK